MSDLTYANSKVYISFARDSPQYTKLILELANRLMKDGITCIIPHLLSPYSSFSPSRIRDYINEADFVLVICTEDYYQRILNRQTSSTKSQSQWEGDIILEYIQKAAINDERFIPVIFDQGDIPFILEPLRAKPYYLVDSPENYFNLYHALTAKSILDQRETERLRDHIPNARLQLPANLWNVPYDQNQFFTGREKLLDDLHQDLMGLSGGTRSQALYGLGGVGKTQIAAEYAYRHRHDYNAVLWMGAESHTVLSTSFLEVARLLGFNEQENSKPDDALKLVKDWLETHSDWLIIFDNADDLALIKSLRPVNRNGSILLTSRAQIFDSIGIFKPIEVEEMQDKDAVEFLLRRAQRDSVNQIEREAATQLAKELGCLPLALEQAGAFIKENKSHFKDFFQSYMKRKIELLASSTPVVGSHPESVVTTWSINFNEIERISTAASELLRIISFLSPDRIPIDILINGAARLSPSIVSALKDVREDPIAVDDLLAPIMRYSLIRRDVNSRTFSIHHLVQEVLKSEMKLEAKKNWSKYAVCALAEACPSPDFKDWPSWDLFLPHAQIAASLIEELDFSFDEAGKLLYQLALYYHERGLFNEADAFYIRAVAVLRKSLEGDDRTLASCLDNLGELYRLKGKYDEAAPLYQEALDIRAKVLDENDPDFALSLNHLGLIFTARGRYKEAEPLFKQSLKIRELSLGENSQHVAGSLNNLAFLYYMLGRYSDAKQLHERALVIRERIHGDDHPYVARSLNNLALVYMALGNIRKAEDLHKRALAIRQDALGPEHPDVAASLNNLATVYREKGDYEEARQLYERSKAIRERKLGVDHPDYSSCLHNIAVLYWEQEKISDAEPLFRRALDIRERKLGADHPYVAYTLYYLGLIDAAQGHLEKARDSYKRSLSIFEASLGNEHPEVAKTLESFASLLNQMGHHAEANTMSERAADIRGDYLQRHAPT